MRWVSEGRQEPSVTWACLEAAARTGDRCKLPQLCIQKDAVAAVRRTDAGRTAKLRGWEPLP